MKPLERKVRALETRLAKLQETYTKVKAPNGKAALKDESPKTPSGLVTLVLRDETTKTNIHSFPDLNPDEFINYRRVFYRVLVKKLGKDVKFKRIVQYSESA